MSNPTGACDPYFQDVVLLLQMGGANGSTVFSDLSLVGNTVTSNAVTVSTAEQLYGLNSAYAPPSPNAGSGEAYCYTLSVPIAAGGPLDILSGTNDFTIECWFYAPTAAYPANNPLFDYGNAPGASGSSAGLICVSATYSGLMQCGDLTGWGNINWYPVGGLNPGVWNHFAVTRYQGVGYAYLNGQLATGVTFPTWSGYSIPAGSELVIGGLHPYESNWGLPSGVYITDFRVTANVARYTANFTPPTAPSPTVACGIPVPNVVGAAVSIAETAIVSAGFVVGAITYAPSGIYAVGIVSVQTPAGGSYVPAGSAVALVVSTGLPDQIVPDLIGLTQAEATSLLLSLGLGVGAIGSANSAFLPSGEISSQNPSPGTSVGAGSLVSFVLSLGEPVAGTMFNYEATLISQYANSPTLLQLVANLNQYLDQSQNFANFYNYVWNVDTAQGFGLDIWGAIVGVSRLLYIPNTTEYIGAYQSSESQPAQDYTPFGSRLNNPPVGGALYTGQNATQAYLLLDPAYRQLILAKAFANICTTTAPAINQILQTLFGAGMAYVLNVQPMQISYNFTFTPTPIQLAILEQSGVIPTPPGVSVTINTDV